MDFLIEEARALIAASQSLLEVVSKTEFHDCSIRNAEPNFGEGDDDLTVDGGSNYLTLGHFRKLRDAMERLRQGLQLP